MMSSIVGVVLTGLLSSAPAGAYDEQVLAIWMEQDFRRGLLETPHPGTTLDCAEREAPGIRVLQQIWPLDEKAGRSRPTERLMALFYTCRDQGGQDWRWTRVTYVRGASGPRSNRRGEVIRRESGVLSRHAAEAIDGLLATAEFWERPTHTAGYRESLRHMYQYTSVRAVEGEKEHVVVGGDFEMGILPASLLRLAVAVVIDGDASASLEALN